MSGPGALFVGSGEMARRMAALDWSATPVGPVDAWPHSLRSTVRMLLSSRYPMIVTWGPQYTQLYNDAYSELIGDGHPAALGGDIRTTLADSWDVLAPLLDEAMTTGVATWIPALQLLMGRSGYREEAYFSVSHAPLPDDEGRVAGMHAVCSEVTEQVIGQRRLRLLRDVTLQAGGIRGSVEETCAAICEVLAHDLLDVPFAVAYVRDDAARVLRRCGDVGLGALDVEAAFPAVVPLDGGGSDPWSLGRAAAGETVEVDGVDERLGLVGGPWDDLVRRALCMPIPASGSGAPLGVLLAGVSPNRALEEAYRSFFELLVGQVSVAVRNARAHAEERERAEALAELDRAKTAFFTDISHEFRTPLTLLLGPLEDALEEVDDGPQRERLVVARRNALRLSRLVNDLLQFSSLEAGRISAVRQPVDLAAASTELASVFRAALERAGLRFVVDCPPLPQPVAVDPEMWETVVLNLLSNALKFTFVGEVEVTLRATHHGVRLTVRDTGIGIPAEELPGLFERFSRVRGSASRTHEGSGIGLALVQQLAKLHGGAVEVESSPGAGTAFTVSLPWGSADSEAAPPPAATSARAELAREEALQWTEQAVATGTVDPAAAPRPRVLVAEDNADMRAYLIHLLSDRYEVEAVADGGAALAEVRRRRPDLLLTDVMMPELDGFELLRAVRGDPATSRVPIVVLSARAGEEAAVEGLDLGADDYVVKPFVARELLARVRATLELAAARDAQARRARGLADVPAVIAGGRALEEAVRSVTDQTRRVLGARAAVTTLDVGEGADPLLIAAAPDAPAPRPSAPLIGGDGSALGSLGVEATPAVSASERHTVLAAATGVLAELVQAHWRPGAERRLPVEVGGDPLPELPGLALAARTVAARGGGWVEAVGLPGGAVALAAGEGAAGAGRVLVRAVVRALLSDRVAPDRVVELLGRLDGGRVAVAVLTPATGGLRWAAAGQPPPLRVASDGGLAVLQGGSSGSEAVAPGSVLLLSTRPLGGREEDLRRAATGELDALLEAALGPDADAGAAVAVRLLGPARLERRYPSEPASVRAVRSELRAFLASVAADDDVSFELLVATSEAATNAIEHAQDPTEPVIDVTFEADDRVVTITVRDHGSWRAREASMDRGRGSALMSAFGGVRVMPSRDGTTVQISRELVPEP